MVEKVASNALEYLKEMHYECEERKLEEPYYYLAPEALDTLNKEIGKDLKYGDKYLGITIKRLA